MKLRGRPHVMWAPRQPQALIWDSHGPIMKESLARRWTMALLNRKVDYSLLILSYLHEHPAGGCARVLAERFDLSRAFVANILKRLCRKGLVGSTRGIKGGYVLMPR